MLILFFLKLLIAMIVTKEKVSFLILPQVAMVSGKRQRTKKIAEMVDSRQSTPNMSADGELSSEIDVNRLLYSLPYHASDDRQ